MQRNGIYSFLLIGLFYFSEGKSCPEKTRQHKTRCDVYYKCTELPTKSHVWVPQKCAKGLVYEHNLGMCVLPGDDWECNIDENAINNPPNKQIQMKQNKKFTKTKTSTLYTKLDDDNDDEIIVFSNEQLPTYKSDNKYTNNNSKNKVDNGKYEIIVGDDNLSSEELEDDDVLNNEIPTNEHDSQIESSGNGEVEELEDLNSNEFLMAENRETEDDIHEQSMSPSTSTTSISTSTMKPPIQLQLENNFGGLSTTHMPHTITQTTSKIDPNLTAHLQRLSQLIDGLKQTYQNQHEPQQELRPDQLNAFLAHFNIKNQYEALEPTVAATTMTPTSITPLLKAEKVQMSNKNKTFKFENESNNLKPETKVMLSNLYSNKYPANSGYSNAQIVVNRPGGAVLFSIPPASSYGGETHLPEYATEYTQVPKISEDTLKTVLELSKQMIANQNVPKIIQNPSYYPQPFIQPVLLPTTTYTGQANPFIGYYEPAANQINYYNHRYKSAKRPGTNSNHNNKPGTTIIHNNVIPVHVTSTNSGEKEIIDAYGQSLGLYPSLQLSNNNNKLNSNSNNNKYISITTVRPIVSTTPFSNFPAQFPTSFPTEISVTPTPQPFDFHLTPTTIANFYTPSPHLHEHNVNSLFPTSDHYTTLHFEHQQQQQQPIYHQQVERPNSQQPTMQLFPPQIEPNKIKIRPNSQKVESMEVDADDVGGGYGPNVGAQQLLSVNYNNNNNNDRPDAATNFNTAAILNLMNSQKNSYLSRPQSFGNTNYINKPIYPKLNHKPHISSISSISSNKNNNGYVDGNQLVNVGGNFISFDAFQNTILPILNDDNVYKELNNVEVITCATGVRQPNTTDCTRYYVCNKQTGKVMSYTCPPYTAFNAQTRICDAHTYAQCNPEAIVNSYTVNENKRIQMEAFQALQQAKKRHEQSLKAQDIANLLMQYNGRLQQKQQEEAEANNSVEKNDVLLSNYMQQSSSAFSVGSTTMRPAMAALGSGGTVSGAHGGAHGGGGGGGGGVGVKKRKYYCKEGDKIPDQTSINNYFVCYKNADGVMKGHKMSCSKSLIFCPKTTMCTLTSKCL